MLKKRVHIVPHIHWDREWYFTTEESRILLVNNMEEILERLENDPDYPHFILDGQTCILEDYFAIKPEYKNRVKKLVEQGKIIIGPWYSQTDTIIVNGESIVRNLMYGIKDCQEFGEHMKIGYLPDSFGQSEQLPQIFRGFDINKAMFWRGCSERHGASKTEFYWQSNDGSKVLAQVLPLGYAIGKYLPNDVHTLQKRLTNYIEVLDKRATTNVLILPNGHDQMPIQQDIHEVITTLHKAFPDCEFFLSSYDKAYQEILSQNPSLEAIQGEFNDGKYMRVHRSISSTRMDIKVLNTRLEYKITNILEPLMSIAYTLGFTYHHGLVEHAWKLIMKNHAHDSIACCCSDEVHREIKERFLLAEDKIDKLITFTKRKIADHNGDFLGEDKLVIYNLLPKERKEIHSATIRIRANNIKLHDEQGDEVDYHVVSKKEIDPGLIDRQIVHYGVYNPFIEYEIQFEVTIPSLGYRIFNIVAQEGEVKILQVNKKDWLENDFYKITVNDNGTINVFNKVLNKMLTNVLLFENGGDDGDEYDYSPPQNDWIITSELVQAHIDIYEEGDIQKAVISYNLTLPKDLQERSQNKASITMPITIFLSLSKHSPIIDIKVSFDCNIYDQRIRIHIPSNLLVHESIADQQFGLITRPLYDKALDVWEEEKWSEKPVNIYSMMSFVGLHNGEEGISCLTKGIREYEILNKNVIALTMMRGVGVLGKSNLIDRPGRPSGISLPTPDSQILGKQSYEFAFYWYQGEAVSSFILGKMYNTPLIHYNKIPYDAMKLNLEKQNSPKIFSLLQIEGLAQLSTIKVSENNRGLVIRIFNPYRDREISSQIYLYQKISSAFLTNLNEEIKQELKVESNTIFIQKILPNQIITILVEL
ncbi:MAG: mannosylglycerate hydrolase [Brevinema sp.]